MIAKSTSRCLKQGDADEFLEQDLTPQALVDAAKKNCGVDINLRMQVRLRFRV